MTNTKLATILAAVGTAVLTFLFVHVFHSHLPQDVDYALPALALIAANSGFGKLIEKLAGEPDLAKVLAEIQRIEQALAQLAANISKP